MPKGTDKLRVAGSVCPSVTPGTWVPCNNVPTMFGALVAFGALPFRNNLFSVHFNRDPLANGAAPPSAQRPLCSELLIARALQLLAPAAFVPCRRLERWAAAGRWRRQVPRGARRQPNSHTPDAQLVAQGLHAEPRFLCVLVRAPAGWPPPPTHTQPQCCCSAAWASAQRVVERTGSP